MKKEILRMEHVTREGKEGVVLDQVSLHIFQGEIMGLIAADHKGKTELIELICQNLPISHGRIYFNNQLVNNHIHSNVEFNKAYVIGQKSSLIQDLTVADNLFVMRRGFKKYLINRRVLGIQVDRLLREFEVTIDPNKPIFQLTTLERCMVEMVKAELSGCTLIILRDLSNFLSAVELEKFQTLILLFKAKQFSFLYVGNHHQELFSICDRAALLNQGRICKIFDSCEMTEEAILPYIISFDLSVSKMTHPGHQSILEFEHINTENLRDFSFSVKKGECLSLFDMSNTVIEEIKELMTGGLLPDTGKILLEGKEYSEEMSGNFLDYGVTVIGDNPIHSMVFQHMSYIENLSFLIDRKIGKSIVRSSVIKSIEKEYGALIGETIHANQIYDLDPIALYDMIYYRIHMFNPKIVFCIQPFAWGDMRCRRHVLDLIQTFKNKGITVVMLAVNLSDSLDVADRLVIIKDGRYVREYMEEEFDQVR